MKNDKSSEVVEATFEKIEVTLTDATIASLNDMTGRTARKFIHRHLQP